MKNDKTEETSSWQSPCWEKEQISGYRLLQRLLSVAEWAAEESCLLGGHFFPGLENMGPGPHQIAKLDFGY